MPKGGEVPPSPAADLPLPHSTRSTGTVSLGGKPGFIISKPVCNQEQRSSGAKRQPGQILSLLAPAVWLDVFTVVLPCINTNIVTSLLFPAGTMPTVGALRVFRDRGAQSHSEALLHLLFPVRCIGEVRGVLPAAPLLKGQCHPGMVPGHSHRAALCLLM